MAAGLQPVAQEFDRKMFSKETRLLIEASLLGAVMCIGIAQAVLHLFN